MQFERKDYYGTEDLKRIMEILRSENGCPWDKEQTHESIRNNFVEETYEVLEAIDTKNPELLREELGDVLLQVVFHSQMEKEQGRFSFDDVADEVCKKLIVRHPHIFSDVVAKTSDEVLKNWDSIKKNTKHQETYTETLKSVPAVFPSLMKAQKLGKRAARAGVDFRSPEDAFEALKKELNNVQKVSSEGNKEKAGAAMGKLLFACTDVARKLGIDCEDSLDRRCRDFIKEFEQLENEIRLNGQEMDALSIDELDSYRKKADETF